jgi:hypothetical protein
MSIHLSRPFPGKLEEPANLSARRSKGQPSNDDKRAGDVLSEPAETRHRLTEDLLGRVRSRQAVQPQEAL